MEYTDWLLFIYQLGCIVGLMISSFTFSKNRDKFSKDDGIGYFLIAIIILTLLSWVTLAMWLGGMNRKNKERL